MVHQQKQRDEHALAEKIRYRRLALRWVSGEPVVLEAFGGWGKIHRACYRSIADGVIFEQDRERAYFLSEMRPEWAVYRGDSLYMLGAGIGKEWPVNFVDFDPYGEPWPFIEAFFQSDRPWPDRLVVAVHDGLRNMLMRNRAWHIRSLEELVNRYGNRTVADQYVVMCRELFATHAARAGYVITQWVADYGGYRNQSTHYIAALDRAPIDTPHAPDEPASQVVP